MSPLDLHESAAEVADLLKCLANHDRLLLLCQLSQGEFSVTELGEQLALAQPSLSQQLGLLRKQGLVDTRREGKKIYYRISDEKVLKVMQLLFTLYCPRVKE